MKYIYFTFLDDGIYSIPASLVAANRAIYYADMEAAEESAEWTVIYNAEYNITMKDNNELIDWLRNNMDFEDIKNDLKLIKEQRMSLKQQYEDAVTEDRVEIYDK